MTWSIATETKPVARKDYRCDACDHVIQSGYDKDDFDVFSWHAIATARLQGCKIVKGTRYVKVEGLYDGDWSTFRARPEIDAICHKYDIYGE